MLLTDILPDKEHAQELMKALGTKADYLYYVGFNAQSFIYGLPSFTSEYNFILTDGVDKLQDNDLEGYDEDIGDGDAAWFKVGDNFISFIEKPIENHLLGSVFAGDAVVLHVQSGRLLCMPEYLTVPPTQRIRDQYEIGLPTNPLFTNEELWNNHASKLATFEKGVTDLAAKLPNAQS